MNIGAWCEIEWQDDLAKGFRYISFGTYDEENDSDSYGVADDAILFYCAESEFLKLVETGSGDFKIINFDYEELENASI
jgi:hypothetical protein